MRSREALPNYPCNFDIKHRNYQYIHQMPTGNNFQANLLLNNNFGSLLAVGDWIRIVADMTCSGDRCYMSNLFLADLNDAFNQPVNISNITAAGGGNLYVGPANDLSGSIAMRISLIHPNSVLTYGIDNINIVSAVTPVPEPIGLTLITVLSAIFMARRKKRTERLIDHG